MAVTVPGVEWRPDPVSSRPIDPRWIILHTIVGTVPGAIGAKNYHIYVRRDGSAVQIQDLLLRGAASVDANPYSIAIAAEDMGSGFPAWSGSDVPAYTPAQVDTIVRIVAWTCRRLDIPAAAVRNSCPPARGGAWHRLGIDGNFPTWPSIYRGREGCQHWSTSRGKACPGDRRIEQINNVILPRVRALLAGVPTGEGFLMALSDAQQRQIYDQVVGNGGSTSLSGKLIRVAWHIMNGAGNSFIGQKGTGARSVAEAYDAASRRDYAEVLVDADELRKQLAPGGVLHGPFKALIREALDEAQGS